VAHLKLLQDIALVSAVKGFFSLDGVLAGIIPYTIHPPTSTIHAKKYLAAYRRVANCRKLKTPKQMNLKSIGLGIATLVLLAACKKDEFYSGVHEKKIVVKLNNQYVPARNIDSAVIISSWPGLTKRARMEVKDNNVEIRLSEFSQTAHKIIVQLFTKTELNNQPLQFETEVSLTPASSELVEVNAPTAFTDLTWKPRVILDYQSPTTRYSAIVGLRTSDPYFEILHLPTDWNKRITVFRGFFKNDFQHLVTGSTWNCGDICSGNMTDRETFTHLPSQVDHLDWNKAGVEVAFYVTPTTINELAFTFDKEQLYSR
jgi:hypothetical protein